MNTSSTIIILAINPVLFNNKSLCMFAYESRDHAKLESEMLREMQKDPFMDEFRHHACNLDQVMVKIDDQIDVVMARAKEIAKETGIVFEGLAGQFKFAKPNSQQDVENILVAIIGDAAFKKMSDKFGILKSLVTLNV